MVYEREISILNWKSSRRTENRMNSFYSKYLVFCVPPQTVTTWWDVSNFVFCLLLSQNMKYHTPGRLQIGAQISLVGAEIQISQKMFIANYFASMIKFDWWGEVRSACQPECPRAPARTIRQTSSGAKITRSIKVKQILRIKWYVWNILITILNLPAIINYFSVQLSKNSLLQRNITNQNLPAPLTALCTVGEYRGQIVTSTNYSICEDWGLRLVQQF